MSASADVVNDDNARAVARVTWALIASRDSVAVLCSELYHRMLQNPDKVSKKAVVDLAEFVFLVAMASESIDYYNEENQAVRFILRRLDEKGDYGLWDKGVNPTPSDLKELSLFWMASCGNGIPKKWSGNTTFHVPFYKILRDAVKEDLVAPSYEKYGITISDDVTPSPTPVAEVPDVEKGSPESGEATPIPIPAKTKVTAPSFLGT